jgi:hypothetical protein
MIASPRWSFPILAGVITTNDNPGVAGQYPGTGSGVDFFPQLGQPQVQSTTTTIVFCPTNVNDQNPCRVTIYGGGFSSADRVVFPDFATSVSGCGTSGKTGFTVVAPTAQNATLGSSTFLLTWKLNTGVDYRVCWGTNVGTSTDLRSFPSQVSGGEIRRRLIFTRGRIPNVRCSVASGARGSAWAKSGFFLFISP